MALNQFDAQDLKKAFLSAAAALNQKKEIVNELNVFPVPDGDTGTNMTMTLNTAAQEVSRLETPTMQQLCKAISSGTLRGARGNSGVILSQLLRGFCKEISEYNYVDTLILASAFGRAVDSAYKAVMKPKEGTILTVAKAMSERAMQIAVSSDDIESFLDTVITAGDNMLERTPDLLPVLKQAGVVDSGGQGLMFALKGALAGLTGQEIEWVPEQPQAAAETAGPRRGAASNDIETADIKFGYCTEFIINAEFSEKDEEEFKAYLDSIGDSIVCVAYDDIVKVHVHTNEPGNAIQKALSYGPLSRMKIDNMREEHNELYLAEAAEEEPAPRVPYGFISVSAGEGLSEVFRSLGVDYIIEGGQTMNPSTDDILQACGQVNADNIFIFPNNKNIILAANQAADMLTDKKLYVVPSATIPQGIAAMIGFIPDEGPEENFRALSEASASVRSCEVTYAIRDTQIDEFEIHQNDIMAIGDSGMLAVGLSIDDTVLNALKKLIGEDSELVSIYYGDSIQEEEAEALVERAEEVFPDVEFELNSGGQPVYFYLISVE